MKVVDNRWMIAMALIAVLMIGYLGYVTADTQESPRGVTRAASPTSQPEDGTHGLSVDEVVAMLAQNRTQTDRCLALTSPPPHCVP